MRAETAMGPRAIWRALVDGGKASLYVAALTGAVGVLIGVLALTGIGIRFSYILVELAGKSLLAVATVPAFIPGPVTMMTGTAIFTAVYFCQKRRAGIVVKQKMEPLVDE